MMTYPAPNGHIIESLPLPAEVTYTCTVTGFDDGRYYSYEVKGAPTDLGIQAIHINRIVDNGSMTIVVKEFSEQELIDYLNNNRPEPAFIPEP